MHPAPSIILFTTLSGLGYGLAAVLGLGLLDPAALATKIAHLLALALIAGGLLSSTLHLGNPQRAWRALSQWRTSWLSREGVMAIATFAPLACSAFASLWSDRYLILPGLLGAVLSGLTVHCTGMIYASLKSVDAWHTPLTPLCHLLFAAAGGTLLGCVVALSGGGNTAPMLALAAVFGIAAWTAKHFWSARARALRSRSTPESATGLGSIGRVRLLERPHSNENYLTREMGFQVARKHAEKLRRLAFAAGAIFPTVVVAVLLLSGAQGGLLPTALALLALAGHVIGILVERWLFFAEARHAVMNYY